MILTETARAIKVGISSYCQQRDLKGSHMAVN